MYANPVRLEKRPHLKQMLRKGVAIITRERPQQNLLASFGYCLSHVKIKSGWPMG